MGDYVLDEDADRPVIGFALPALDGEKVVAVAFATIDVRGIGDGGLAAMLPADAGFGLIDGRGTMLLRHPEPDRWAGQPLPAIVSQSSQPALHDPTVHVPPAQLPVAFGGAHAAPQAPQSVTVESGASHPSAAIVLQSP